MEKLKCIFRAACAAAVCGAWSGAYADSSAATGEAPNTEAMKLVWSDEFEGDRLDASKWSYRTNFWGKRASWFAGPEDGAVTVKGGCAHLRIVKRADGSYCSPQLQTGGLLWDELAPKSGNGVVWPFRPRGKPKFMHRYGYYECRFRLQRKDGWWSAFWMQSPANGATLDPRRSGVECDIMESFEPGYYIVHAFHYNGCGPEYRKFNAQRAPYTPTPDGAFKQRFPASLEEFHVFGLLWEPDGYTVFVDGRQSGFKVGRGEGEAVSETEQFLLVSTELKGFRKNNAPDPEVEAAYAAGDEFIVDYVRVYDLAK
jgi:beta-glucanase (GH16 family)